MEEEITKINTKYKQSKILHEKEKYELQVKIRDKNEKLKKRTKEVKEQRAKDKEQRNKDMVELINKDLGVEKEEPKTEVHEELPP